MTGSAFIHAATWLRVLPDVVFDVGAVALLGFVVRAIARDLALRRGERTKGQPGIRRAA